MKSLLAAFLLLCGVVSVEARSLEDILETGFLRIAVYRDFPPYSYLEEGAPAGIDVEVGKKIAEQLGVQPAWFWLTADENLDDDLRNAVWKGHYMGGGVADIMLRVPYDVNYDNDMVSIVSPYHKERWTVARNTEKLPELVNLAPFMYHKIGVEVDSAPDLTLTTALRGRLVENVVHYLSIGEAVGALKEGEIDAVAGMRSQVEWSVKATGKPQHNQKFDISDDSIVGWSRRAWDIGIAVKSSFPDLAKKVETAVTMMADDGQFAPIFDQYQVSYELPTKSSP
ncbi:MAG: transporter substrate-binding domain-containing protein [Gammaproteobacteria bacterium]|nr:MAG: transporter substrate-binding domain-containing protein [Gammaproteobacteria bacterium]